MNVLINHDNNLLRKKMEEYEINDVGNMLLKVGSLLMSSGASTGRVRTTVERISKAFGHSVEMLITNRAITLSIGDENNTSFFSSLKRTNPHVVNFKIVSGISRMSWRVVHENWNVEQINNELNRLTNLPHYQRLIVLTTVSIAGAAFCRIFGGGLFELIVTFIATFAGLFIRQETTKMMFNPYLCVYFASLTASLLSGFALKMGFGTTMEHAFAASVLFLIPGVPLINSFTDLIDGNTLNGLVRGINGMIIALSIALGLLTAMFLYHL